MMAVMICRGSTSECRAKAQRKIAGDAPRASCCGTPSRSMSSSAVMKTTDVATKRRKRFCIQREERLPHRACTSIERDELVGNPTICAADLLIRDEERAGTRGDDRRVALII